jgi:hypothetical protein
MDLVEANSTDKSKNSKAMQAAKIAEPLAELDVLLSQLVASVPVAIMPGAYVLLALNGHSLFLLLLLLWWLRLLLLLLLLSSLWLSHLHPS